MINRISCDDCKYKKLFYEIKVGVYETSNQGKVVDINPYGLMMLGYSSLDEIKNLDIKNDIYFNPDDRDMFLERVNRIGFLKNFEIALKRKDGKKLVVSETSFVNRDSEGTVLSYFGIIKDITESKDVEGQLKEYVEDLADLNRKLVKSETELKTLNASKDKFFSILAHDLRAPFTSLIGLTDFLVDDIKNLSNDDIVNFSKKINTASKNIYNLVENLLQWSRLQTGAVEFHPFNFDLYVLVDEVISTVIGVSVKKKIEIINDVKENTIISADRNMIYSVIQNLIANALKFTEPGGLVKIYISDLTEEVYTVTVKDTGIGISPADMKKIFRIDEHFTTRGTNEEKGTGLGLILCKELIERNGGNICVDSVLGEGSSFIFTVKRKPD